MAKADPIPGMALATIDNPEDAVAALRGQVAIAVEDPEAVATAIMERILSAENADEVLGGSGAIHGLDVLSRPFTLHGVRLLKSSFDKGIPVFALLDAEFLDDGSRASVTSSARNVVTQAVMLWRLDALPRNVVIRQSDTPTASGYNVLWLESA